MQTRLPLALAFTLALALFAGTAGAAGVDSFRPYAAGLMDRLVQGVERLDAAVEDGNLDAAQSAWIDARYGWERGETFYAVFFPEYDTSIDSWPDAEHGFHALEVALFKQRDLDAAAELSERLLEDVRGLQAAFAATELTEQGLMDGLAGLAFEIGAAKAGGGESPFSGTSLQDMRNNMVGVETTYYLVFAPELSERKPQLHRAILNSMVELTAALRAENISQLDQQQVMRLSERLAGQLVRAAEPLGLEPPSMGG